MNYHNLRCKTRRMKYKIATSWRRVIVKTTFIQSFKMRKYFASELLENFEEMFTRVYMRIIYIRLKSSTTQLSVARLNRVWPIRRAFRALEILVRLL